MFWISKWHATHSPPYTTFQTKASDNKRRFHFPEIILQDVREIYTYKYNVGVRENDNDQICKYSAKM